jgi:hypothetical protein
VPAFQNGRDPRAPRINRKRRFYRKIGPKGRLHRRPLTRGLKEIHDLRPPRSSLPIQKLTFRIKRGSARILKHYANGSGTTSEGGDTAGLLPGRYMRSRQIKNRNGRPYETPSITPQGPGIPYQLSQEPYDSDDMPGIPRVPVQYQEDAHNRPHGKAQQSIEQDQAGEEEDLFLPLDSQSFGEDNSDAPSSGECITAHPISSEGSSPKLTPRFTTMGEPVSSLEREPTGIAMVGGRSPQDEWSSHTDDESDEGDSQGDDLHGCVGLRLGNNIRTTDDIGTLVDRGERNQHKRPRTEDDSVCHQSPRRKSQRLAHKTIHRQHNSSQIREETRRHFLTNTARTGFTDPQHLTEMEHNHFISPHSRSPERGSGRAQPQKTATVRRSISQEVLCQNRREVGETIDRRICNSFEQQGGDLLESIPRSGSISDGCFPTAVAQEGTLPSPTMEINTSNSPVLPSPTPEGSNSGDTLLANTILVSDDPAAGIQTTTNIQDKEKPVPGRLEIIRAHRRSQGMEEDLITFLEGSHRKGTKRAYNKAWTLWTDWCRGRHPPVDFLEYNLKNLHAFFFENKYRSLQSLRTCRAALASVFQELYPDETRMADHQSLKSFFKAKTEDDGYLTQKTSVGNVGHPDTDSTHTDILLKQ